MSRAVVAPPLIGIVGPTASGKTELALALARSWPVEILVADSRQVYRGMDIGTAKPDAVARAAVPHHLLDLVDPDQPFTVAQWVKRARELVAEISGRGRIAMLVGGTGLYVTALIDGHDYASQPWAPEVRARLANELEEEGLESLVGRLASVDPLAAARTDPRNPRRVLRALERVEAGGGEAIVASAPYGGRVGLIAISRSRDVLRRRIEERASHLFAGGLLDEVRALQAAGYGADLPPMSGHGYREAIRHLAGEWSLDEAIEATARRTRQYAKRQMTWFRRDPRIMWLPAGSRSANAAEVVAGADGLLRAALS